MPAVGVPVGSTSSALTVVVRPVTGFVTVLPTCDVDDGGGGGGRLRPPHCLQREEQRPDRQRPSDKSNAVVAGSNRHSRIHVSRAVWQSAGLRQTYALLQTAGPGKWPIGKGGMAGSALGRKRSSSLHDNCSGVHKIIGTRRVTRAGPRALATLRFAKVSERLPQQFSPWRIRRRIRSVCGFGPVAFQHEPWHPSPTC